LIIPEAQVLVFDTSSDLIRMKYFDFNVFMSYFEASMLNQDPSFVFFETFDDFTNYSLNTYECNDLIAPNISF